MTVIEFISIVADIVILLEGAIIFFIVASRFNRFV